jgi:hypothetical protein
MKFESTLLIFGGQTTGDNLNQYRESAHFCDDSKGVIYQLMNTQFTY